MPFPTVILAAGYSRRMRREKLGLPILGRSCLERAIDAPFRAGAAPIVVVLRDEFPAPAPEQWAGAVEVVRNTRPDLGMSHSIRLGLEALADPAEWWFLALADLPLVTGIEYEVLASAAAHTHSTCLRPEYRGEHGHPVLLHRIWRERILGGPGIPLNKLLIRHLGEISDVPVPSGACLRDMDTPTDYQEILTRES